MSKTKEQLLKELQELEQLENTVESKKSDLEYKKMETPFKVGGKYYIRTVTYHVTGEVKAIVGQFLVLKDAAWIADSGRFMEAIVKGILNEVEPVIDDVFVNQNSITDAYIWNHKLPREQK
jgi:hypothetical protein